MTSIDRKYDEPVTTAEPPPSLALRLLARDLVPDWLIRRRIRALDGGVTGQGQKRHQLAPALA
jgi:hypothetical protein